MQTGKAGKGTDKRRNVFALAKLENWLYIYYEIVLKKYKEK